MATMNTTRAVVGLLSSSVLMGAVGCGKPCQPIPQSETVKRLGIVLDGGSLCKDEAEAATIDYAKVKGGALQGNYQEALTKGGWKTERATDYMLLATKDKDLLLVTTAGRSKDRGVPFAIVKYCVGDAICSKSMRDLFEASKKYAN
jgi:hypothetical protein